MTSPGVKVTVDYSDRVRRLNEELPDRLRRKIGGRAARSAGAVVARAARKRAPDSKKSGSRAGWSEKLAARRAGVKQMKRQIKVRALKRRDLKRLGLMEGFGAKVLSPMGHLHEYGWEHFQWGRKAGTMPARPWFRPAVDATRGEAQRKMIDVITRGLAKEAKKAKGGTMRRAA